MDKAVRHTALIFFLAAIFSTAGCQTTKPPLAPDKLTYEKMKSGQTQDAEAFAEKFAQEKRQKKQPKSLKTTDPAWASIRKQRIDSAKTFTLIELVDLALRNNPKTRQAWQNTR